MIEEVDSQSIIQCEFCPYKGTFKIKKEEGFGLLTSFMINNSKYSCVCPECGKNKKRYIIKERKKDD